MQRMLENLRARPSHEKRRISLQVSAGITAAIFVIWVSTLGVRLANRVEPTHTASNNPSELVAAVAAAGTAMKEQVGKMTNALSSAGSGDVTWTATSSTPEPEGADPAIVISTAGGR